MKRMYLFIMLGMLLFFLHAVEARKWSQPPSTVPFIITDTISMIEVPFISAGATGDSCVWDFAHIKDSLPRDFLVATSPSDSTRYAITKAGTRYHYRMNKDSVWQLGYENNQMKMLYTNPLLLLTYPLTYHDTIHNEWYGAGEYCHLLPTSAHGQSVSLVDGQGVLHLPNAILDSVMRVHTTQTVCEHLGDTLLSTIHRYQWYCPQIQYPLLETIEVIADSTIYAAAFYYQYADTLRQHVDSIMLPEEQDTVPMVFTEAQFLPNPVVEDLHISYKLTQTATIHFSLHNNVGLVMYFSNPEQQEEGEHSKTIPMGSYPQGTYVLYIHVDDVILSETIIKQ